MRYTVILEQEPDGGYVASVPARLGCVSQSDTRDEAMKNIREATDPDGWRASVPKALTLPHYPMVLHRGGYPDGS